MIAMRLRSIVAVCDDTMARRARDDSSSVKFVPFSRQLHIRADAIASNAKQKLRRTICISAFSSLICRAVDANEFHCAMQEPICSHVVEAQLGVNLSIPRVGRQQIRSIHRGACPSRRSTRAG
jgi:hypothetical protein